MYVPFRSMTSAEELEEAIQDQIADHLQIAAAEMDRARRLAGKDSPVSGDMTSIRTWILGLIDEEEPDRDVDLEIHTSVHEGGKTVVHILKEENVDEEEMSYLDNRDHQQQSADDGSEEEEECETCIIEYDDSEEHTTFKA